MASTEKSEGKTGQLGQSVRVVVRVRPLTETDGAANCDALSVDHVGLHVPLTSPIDRRSSKQFQFDAALGSGASQVCSGYPLHNLIMALTPALPI